jgi:hypothetical protein
LKRTTLVAALLTALGLLQMAAEGAGLPALRGLAIATTASPAPRVFSAVDGLETYSTRFTVEWTDPEGRPHSLEITPEAYAGLRGPYNRRNAYGAVVAYGPILAANPATREMFESVARFALCGDAPLLRELGVDPSQVAGAARIRLTPQGSRAPAALPLVLEAPCR